jgi:hypothetical protein
MVERIWKNGQIIATRSVKLSERLADFIGDLERGVRDESRGCKLIEEVEALESHNNALDILHLKE